MIIGSCTVELYLPSAHSLKDKRSVVKSVVSRVRREFNVGIAEVDHQDVWHTAVLGIVAVSNDTAYLHGMLSRVVQWIDHTRLDAQLVDFHIEIL
jgi:uncharacterized protein YlxP (DUF503 family)